MAWTYSPSMDSDKDKVRFLIQDTNENKPIFQDEEIVWTLTQAANIYTAAADMADALVAKAGNVKGKKISDFAIQYDTAFYMRLSGTLRARGAGHQIPYAGGISIADKTLQQDNTDATTPSVVRHLDDNPAAPAPQTPPANPLTTI